MGRAMKEKVFVVGLMCSLELRIGWEIWKLWRAVWRFEISGGFERRRDRTVMPVPPGMALHQLYSVTPRVRPLGSPGCALRSSSDMMCADREKKTQRDRG